MTKCQLCDKVYKYSIIIGYKRISRPKSIRVAKDNEKTDFYLCRRCMSIVYDKIDEDIKRGQMEAFS